MSYLFVPSMMSFLLALATPFIFVGLMVAGLFSHPQQPPVEQSIGVAPRTLVESQGGTGTSTYVVGDILYSNATDQLTGRNIGSAGQVLTVAGGVPTWAAAAGFGEAWILRNGALTPSTTVGIMVNASSSIGSSLNVSGNLNASSTFFVSGLSNLMGGFISNASSSVGAGLQVAGALNASTSLFTPYVSTTSNTVTSTFTQGGFSVAQNKFVVQQTTGRIGVGIANPTNYIDITEGTLSNDQMALNLTATLGAVPTAAIMGAKMLITSAGSAAQNQTGLDITFGSGYSGGNTTIGANMLSGVGGSGFNIGFNGASTGAGGRNIGVTGFGTGASTANFGGYFALENGPGNIGTDAAALVANQAGIAGAPIFIGKANGIERMRIDSLGGINETVSSSFSGTVNITNNLNASTSLFIGTGTLIQGLVNGTFNTGIFMVDSSGNVSASSTLTTLTGINPVLKIRNATASNVGRIDFFNNLGTNYAGIYAHDGTGEIRFGAYASNYFPSFYSNNLEAARIDTTGAFDVNYAAGTFDKGRFSVAATGAVTASSSIQINSAQDTNLTVQRAGVNMVYLGDSGSADAGDLILYTSAGGFGTFLRGGTGQDSYFNNSAKVGIMTNAPLYALDVQGNAHVNTDLFVSSSIYVASSTANRYSVSTTGAVALNSIQPNAQSDDFLCWSTTGVNAGEVTHETANCTISGRRFKDNILPLPNALKAVLAMKPVQFRNKTNDKQEVGFIAEDMAEIDRRVVVFDPDGQTRTIDYDKLTAYLAGAIQDQQKLIKKLEARIKVLENNQK